MALDQYGVPYRRKQLSSVCHYCRIAVTAWQRTVNGVEVYVCFDCIPKWQNEQSVKRQELYNKRRKLIPKTAADIPSHLPRSARSK